MPHTDHCGVPSQLSLQITVGSPDKPLTLSQVKEVSPAKAHQRLLLGLQPITLSPLQITVGFLAYSPYLDHCWVPSPPLDAIYRPLLHSPSTPLPPSQTTVGSPASPRHEALCGPQSLPRLPTQVTVWFCHAPHNSSISGVLGSGPFE